MQWLFQEYLKDCDEKHSDDYCPDMEGKAIFNSLPED